MANGNQKRVSHKGIPRHDRKTKRVQREPAPVAAADQTWDEAKQREFKAMQAKRMRESIARIGLRKVLESRFYYARWSIADTFNHCNDPAIPWEFPSDALKQVEEHMCAITAIFENSTVRLRADPGAQCDAGFQRFMQSIQGTLSAP